MTGEEWYDNKTLYEMMVELSRGLEKTNIEMARTQVLIRDYNGLREKIDSHDAAIAELCGKSKGGAAMWGYVVGGLGILFGIITLAVKGSGH